MDHALPIDIEEAEAQLGPAAELLKAAADPTRLRILNLAAGAGEVCNCHIEAVTGYGQTKISRHLALLKRAGLIRGRRDGLWIHYSLKPAEAGLAAEVLRLARGLAASHPVFLHDLDLLARLRRGAACSPAAAPASAGARAGLESRAIDHKGPA